MKVKFQSSQSESYLVILKLRKLINFIIIYSFFCHLCGINLQTKDEILKHKDDHKKGKIISNQFKKNI